LVVRVELAQARVFFLESRNFCTLQIFKPPFKQMGSFESCQIIFFKKLVLSTRLWQYAKMITTLKAPIGLKNFECKKGQLSKRPPILYVAETDLTSSKEEPQVLKVKLPDDSHLNMPIYSHGNTKEYLTHIVAVLRIIKQKGLDVKCRKLGKAVVRQSKTLKNLIKASGIGC
jgi:hypothetical protein